MPSPGSIFSNAAFFAVALQAAVPAAGGAEKTFANYPRLFLDTRATFAYAQLYMDDQITLEHGFLGETELNGNVNILYLKPGHIFRASSLYLGMGYSLTRPYWDQPIDQSLRLSAGIDLNRFFNAYLSQSVGAPESQGALGVSIKMFESHFADWFIGARIMETKYAIGSDVDVLERWDFGVSMMLRLHNGLRKDSAGSPGRKVRTYSQEDPIMREYVHNRTEIEMDLVPKRISGDSMAARKSLNGIIDSIRADTVFIKGAEVRSSDIRRILPAERFQAKEGDSGGDGVFHAVMIVGTLLVGAVYIMTAVGKSMRGS